ncbi:hypothetical protein [Streptomyces sp. SBT349]|uniref:hypothetical protein n=1 Tax=Streptomyces sp. SBT349 TaxID=1580539 RepID=UPI00066D1144|nr:hypothetical protein [Streptomyces sp. SBT349]
MSGVVLVSVEVDATTVRRGDEIMIGGQIFTVSDLTAAPRGGKRLEFASGETFLLRPHTVLWAARRISPRRPPPRAGARGPRAW